MKSKSIGIGIIIFIILIAGALLLKFLVLDAQAPGSDPSKPKYNNLLSIKGFVGGEKLTFLEDEEVQRILAEKYKIKIDYTKAGSIEMVQQPFPADTDFLWPSSQVALELFKMTQSQKLLKSEIIFSSPIVFYSWDIVTDALINLGIVKKIDNSYYIVDFPKMTQLILEGKKWSDIGLPELFGKVVIISTDPSKSNSGNMFAGLLANMMVGDVVTESTIDSILPQIKDFFSKLGYMEHSSSDLFEQYLRTGVGAKPIIAGYENQIIEFSLQYKDLWPKVKDKIRILYPRPTVWSSHALIVISDKAKVLIEIFKDEAIQKLAWEKHGFRTGLVGIQNDPKVIEILGIPENITQVISMPNPQVMDKIIQSIKTK